MKCIPIFIVGLYFYEAVLSSFQCWFINAMAGHFIWLKHLGVFIEDFLCKCLRSPWVPSLCSELSLFEGRMERRIQGGFIEHPENTCTRHCAWSRTAGLIVLLLQCNKLLWQHSALPISPNCLALHFHISLFNYHIWDKENMRAMELNHVSNQKLSL